MRRFCSTQADSRPLPSAPLCRQGLNWHNPVSHLGFSLVARLRNTVDQKGCELPYEVFSQTITFIRCADLHGPHQTLQEAKRCFDQIDQRQDGIAVHPSTGKCIHAIAAVAEDGTQLQFTGVELELVDALAIDRRIVLENVPNVTTFAYIAGLSYAALRTIPQLTVDLGGFFEYKNRNQHYWSTEEGLGQLLAHVQQAYFTLELCLKALLETTGQLVKIPEGKWKEHEPSKLFNLLNRETRQLLEQQWSQVPATSRPTYKTFEAYLTSIDDMYKAWRYVPERKDANLSAEPRQIVVACEIVLGTSSLIFRRDYPMKLRITSETISSGQGQDPSNQSSPIIVSGTVTSVNIPDGFNPHSTVEVSVGTKDYGQLTLEFYKRNPEDYHGLEGRHITVGGFYNPNRPTALRRPNIVQIEGKERRETSYSVETRTLQGTIYNITRPLGLDHPATVNLVLKDETYFTMVQCLLVTEEERVQISGTVDSARHFQFGDRISVRGQVTLKNGLPLVLVGPNSINKLAPQPNL